MYETGAVSSHARLFALEARAHTNQVSALHLHKISSLISSAFSWCIICCLKISTVVNMMRFSTWIHYESVRV